MPLKSVFLLLFWFLVTSNQGFTQVFNSPESIEYYAPSNTYFISNTGSNAILRRSASGALNSFLTVTPAPYGIEIVNDTLYACSGGGIKAYQLPQGSLIYTAPLGGTFLNGITHDAAGNLFITDFSAKRIYFLNTSTRQSSIFISNTVSTPNGIIYDPYDGLNPRLVVACWGASAAVRQISLNDSTMTVLTNTNCTNIDGIAKGRNGLFFLACWSSDAILQYDSTFTGISQAVVTGLSNPADIYYNFATDTLAVPNSGQSTVGGANNTVTFHHWPFVITGQEQAGPKHSVRVRYHQDALRNETSNDLRALEMMDVSGKIIYRGSLGANQHISLPGLTAGLYILNMSLNTGETISQKIHIQHP